MLQDSSACLLLKLCCALSKKKKKALKGAKMLHNTGEAAFRDNFHNQYHFVLEDKILREIM